MKPPRRRPRVGLPGLLLVLVCGAAAGGAAEAAEDLPDSGSLLLPPDQERELCRTLQAGQALEWQFDSGLPIGLTAHYHRNQEARGLWRKDELLRDRGSLVAAFPARYCLTWVNYQDRALTLRWQVHLRP